MKLREGKAASQYQEGIGCGTRPGIGDSQLPARSPWPGWIELPEVLQLPMEGQTCLDTGTARGTWTLENICDFYTVSGHL